jgi:hypothetical protein
MKPKTQSILSLTEKPYDEYNAILPVIKQKLGRVRAPVFETTLVEELPLTTCRRAYRTAIMVACGESKVYRETEHQKPVPEPRKVKPKK